MCLCSRSPAYASIPVRLLVCLSPFDESGQRNVVTPLAGVRFLPIKCSWTEHYIRVAPGGHVKVSGLCFDMQDTHPLHIEPVAALRADDAHEHVVTRRTAHDRPHGAHVDGEFTNHPGGAAMRTRFLNERHFKWENFSQDTACGIPIKCSVVHQDLLSDRNAL